MGTVEDLKNTFANNGGIMKTVELNNAGYHSRKIHKLLVSGVISKIKTGVYELTNEAVPDEIMLMKLFPFAVIYLESALLHYGYTERIPAAWQIAVDKDIAKGQFAIGYPPVEPFYLSSKFLDLGITVYEISGVKIRIYDRERTICDVLRYANKLDREVFNAAVQNYIKESEKNISKLAEYAKILRVTKKVKSYFGVWL